MTETHRHDAPTKNTEDFWEDFYQEREQVWSGSPNILLVREIDSVTPGSALDLGCAEGADAIWLAERGWRVTATDVSRTALERAKVRAAEKNLDGAIDWQRHDFDESFPDGRFDLVSAQFLHSPVAHASERSAILSKAADAVAPGGLLLIVGHAGFPSWAPKQHDVHLPSTAEVLTELRLDPEQWDVELEEVVERDFPSPDGEPGVRQDNVLRVRRR
ncbi:class I SAM-dependent methyltransferase [Nocardia callitridis]|uniref:Class I SAM-dependent methyltransferase n=1 Tax=Nocardia callitridis TaxID=648753 RepID=A0ABP9L627_9NOCA